MLLEGAEFPALPTFAGHPKVGSRVGAVVDASTEEPLVVALAPMAKGEPPALPRQRPFPIPMAPPVPRRRRRLRRASTLRWRQVAARGAVVLVAVGAGAFLLFGPGPVTPPAATPLRVPRTIPPGGGMPAQEPVSASAAPTIGLRARAEPLPKAGLATTAPPLAPTTPGGSPSPGGGAAAAHRERVGRPPAPIARAPNPGAAAGAPSPSPPTPPRAVVAPAQRVAAPPARRLPSAPGPGPAGEGVAALPDAPRAKAVAHPVPSAGRTSDQMVVETLATLRPALEACVRQWQGDDPGSGRGGRRVTMTLVVNPSGTVNSPVLDDPALEDTGLGDCLRDVFTRPFPTFEGEPLQLVVPLKLGE